MRRDLCQQELVCRRPGHIVPQRHQLDGAGSVQLPGMETQLQPSRACRLQTQGALRVWLQHSAHRHCVRACAASAACFERSLEAYIWLAAGIPHSTIPAPHLTFRIVLSMCTTPVPQATPPQPCTVGSTCSFFVSCEVPPCSRAPPRLARGLTTPLPGPVYHRKCTPAPCIHYLYLSLLCCRPLALAIPATSVSIFYRLFI